MASAHFRVARQAAKLVAKDEGDAEVVVRLGNAKTVGLDVRIDGRHPRALWLFRELMFDDRGVSDAHVLQFYTEAKSLKPITTVEVRLDGKSQEFKIESKDGGETWSNRWFQKRYRDASEVENLRVYGDGSKHLKTVVETIRTVGSVRLDSGAELALVVFEGGGAAKLVTVTRDGGVDR